MDTDGFKLRVNTKDVIKGLKYLEYLFDFSNLDKKHEILGNKNEKLIGKFETETPKKIIIPLCMDSAVNFLLFIF